MARMSADKADCRDYAQTLINLKARRVLRRWKQATEDYIAMRHDEVAARGGDFDYKAVAIEAVEHGEQMFSGTLEPGEDVPNAA